MRLRIPRTIELEGSSKVNNGSGLAQGATTQETLALDHFIASAFSFFRLKEGPSGAGVSDI